MITFYPHLIAEERSVPDGMGGSIPEEHARVMVVDGLLDLLDGSDRANSQNALVEESTHVLVIMEHTEGITDDMHIIDRHGRIYDITYVDDPADQQNHNEILCALVPGQTYEWSVDDG